MLIRCCDDGRAEAEGEREREHWREERGMKREKKGRDIKRQSERGNIKGALRWETSRGKRRGGEQ